MDTDSSLLPSALIFAASLLFFSYLSLAEHAAAFVNGNAGARFHRGLGFIISSFKYASIIGVAVSGIALALSFQALGWWPIAILSLGLLVVLTILNRAAYTLAAKRPNLAFRWSGVVFRVFSARIDRRNGASPTMVFHNGNNPETPEEIHAEWEERVIAAAASGSIDERDREMLRSILRLDETAAREIMVPRLDMVTVDVNSTLPEVAALMGEKGHSRLPVFSGNIDTIVGVAHSRDLLTILGAGGTDAPLRDALRPAFFIPESIRLDALLEDMQEKSLQMAIVVDEYGGTEGLVTMEDLLEEIVGEIEDEFSRSQGREVVRLPNGSALVDAGVTTDDLKELFGTEIESEDVDTVGGYVYHSLGRIPQIGDTVHTKNVRIEVVSLLGRRLRKLRIDPVTEDSVASPPA